MAVNTDNVSFTGAAPQVTPALLHSTTTQETMR